MEFTAGQIAQLLNGEIQGDENVTLNNIAKIEEGQTGCLSFLANLKYEQYLYTCESSAILIAKDFKPKQAVKSTLILVDDPYQAFATLLKMYEEQMRASKRKSGIHASAVVEENCTISDSAYIAAQTVVESNVQVEENTQIYPQVYLGNNVKIGKNTTIFSGVKIYDNCIIGDNCILHSGVIIGADGFGFAPQKDGSYDKVPQTGNVIVGDNVEIGANTCIDRATIGSTIIEDGVKLDNLVQIAHNVKIGKNTVIAAQTGISGSTELMNNCLVGGQVGIVGHLKIAPHTKINAQSGVSKSVKKEGTALNGTPAFDYTESLRLKVLQRKLPLLFEKVKNLEKIIANS